MLDAQELIEVGQVVSKQWTTYYFWEVCFPIWQ